MFITLNQLKTSISKTLSATMKEINKKVDNDELTLHTSDSNIHVTEEEKQTWNTKSNFSGKYTDLTDIPTDLASTTYVDNKVADIVNSAPDKLDTLNELANALGNDENFATTVTNSLAEKASKDDLNNHVNNGNIHVTVQDKEKWNNKTGKSTTGKEYTVNEQIITAGTGAEIFNAYDNNKAIGNYSHAEGYGTTASGEYSHAEGRNTTASGSYSHAEGYGTTASNNYSHAEGNYTTASGIISHAEGSSTEASGSCSHAEGYGTIASGEYSHTEGCKTTASSDYQHVQGKYNIEDTNDKYSHIVGNGKNEDNRSNAHTLDWNGNAWFAGKVYVGGTSQDDAVELGTNFNMDNFYTKSDIDSMEFISIADIDEICGANIVSGNEVTY